jgi:hypothetical protein
MPPTESVDSIDQRIERRSRIDEDQFQQCVYFSQKSRDREPRD